ncbi:MAG: ABC transporter substrate binding protein [Pyrinomonadaceae bacterium]
MTLPDHVLAKIVVRNGNDTLRAPCRRIPCRTPLRKLISVRQSVFLLLLIVAPFLLTSDAVAQPATKKVLILSGSDPNHPGFLVITQRFRSIVRDGTSDRVELLYEIQEALNAPPASPRHDEELTTYLKRKYAGQKIDLILAAAAIRLSVLMKNDPELFAGIPIVFYDFEAERDPTYRDLGSKITGVWAKVEYANTLDLALALQPDARRVVVVVGTSSSGKLHMERAQAEFRKYEGRVEFNYLTDLTLAELKDQLAALPRDTIVYFLTFYTDRAGNRYPGAEALTLIAPTSGAPIYGHSNSYLGAGIIGGYLIDFDEIGKRLGDVSLRILNGEKPADIPSQTVPNVAAFDWRELRRWGISEQKLPPGSVVRFKQLSLWEQYKWYIVAAIAAFIIEALLIVWLLIVQRRRRRAERERERFASLAEAEHRHLDETVSNVPGIVWEALIDPGTNKLKTAFISDYVEKMLGYTSEEWLSSAPGFGLRIMPEDDRERATRDGEAVMSTGKVGVSHFRWKTKDGRLLWIESHLSPIVDRDGKIVGLRGVSIDVTERKLAEEALKESENQVRHFVEHTPVAVAMFDREMRYLLTSRRWLKDNHLGEQDIIGRSHYEVVPDIPERWREGHRRCLAGAVERREEDILQHPDGTFDWVRWEVRPWYTAGGEIGGIIMFSEMITERKLAEEALQTQRELLEVVAHYIPASVCLIGSDLRLQMVNPAYQAIAPGKEMVGKTLAELWPEGGQDLAAICRRVLETGEPYQVLDDLGTVRRTPDGPLEPAYFSWSLHRVRLPGDEGWGLLNTAWETTERKQADEALRESEARFRNMADSAPVLIWVNGLEGCEFVNRSYLEYLGCSMNEVLNMDWSEAIHPEDVEPYVGTYLSAFEKHEPFEGQFRFRRADGEYRWFKSIGLPRITSDGKFLGYVGSSVDVTEFKDSEVALQRALEEVNQLKNQLHEENIYLREEIKLEHNFSEIVGHSDAIKYVLHKIEQVAPTDSTILIMGETGTGKELAARAIHSESLRASRPLVKVNCAALSASLIESELFGHEKGAFTGALSRKMGRFELADGATIFLDEIGELPLELQVKLLRVLQEGELERLGGTKTIKVNVRVITATNRHLWEEVQNGRFREDLWYRLNVFPITMPPLRQRGEDIPLLVEHFGHRFSKKMGKKITSVAPATLKALRNYSWPGNVRELANVIERAVITNEDTVLLIPNISEALRAEEKSTSDKTLEEMEREYIITVLDNTGGRIEGPHGAARILGLHPSTLRTRMAKLKIKLQQSVV